MYREACARDLEGIVAKWKRGPYHTDGVQTSWLKIRTPEYSQIAVVCPSAFFQRSGDSCAHFLDCTDTYDHLGVAHPGERITVYSEASECGPANTDDDA